MSHYPGKLSYHVYRRKGREDTGMTKWLLRSMTELSSRKWISRLTGRFAHSRASRRFIPRFVRIYGIRVEEAEKPLEQYTTLNEFLPAG
ncbi:hypothetical protein PACILC2_51970 [Paenibacillus cisolokensis]|uniref:Uncharacterized protein n=2 Tax=Paenibacillus cisolokensis TaxID=1658519 RepID=A0ABQ4NEI3_9BACL|nr:hypothetical protein PACILC2_51970 [Paenibacillus cisolokensis]